MQEYESKCRKQQALFQGGLKWLKRFLSTLDQSRGESILARALKEHLPDDYVVYHEPIVANRRPDFVVIGPDIGVIILEVKDFSKDTIIAANRDHWVLHLNGSIVKRACPLSQARNYALHICDVLKKDSQLIVHDGPHKGNLKFPYGYGVVFTKMTQRDFVQTGLYGVLPPELVLTRDEFNDHSTESNEELLDKIRNMFSIRFKWEPLSNSDITAIRYHLFPEVRIAAKVETEEAPQYEQTVLFHLKDTKVMDLYQEKLAKGIGDKHRLLRGVAGSGKTLILACRAKYLAQLNPHWHILVLCYNISLARFIQQMIEEIEVDTKASIEVNTFHRWLAKEFRLRDAELVPELLTAIESGKIDVPKYDAILIDEGQDFDPRWLKLVFKAINPQTQCLLLVEDRAQQIYHRKSLNEETGLNFRGRSRILQINYRNTEQIVQFAWDFYRQFAEPRRIKGHDEAAMEIIAPQSTQRKGPEPFIRRFQSFEQEASAIAREIVRLKKEEGINYDEVAVLYRVKKLDQDYVALLRKHFKHYGIPHYWLSESPDSKRQFRKKDAMVKISTVESSKGLEFKAVFICNIDNFPLFADEVEREVALLYIGMTRAMERLYLTYSGVSEFTQYLEGLSK